MGSYCDLKIGHFELGSWKSHVPLETMLLFRQDDFKVGQEDERDTFRFVTKSAEARQRLDRRGFTLPVCKGLYERYRNDVLRQYQFEPLQVWERPNDITFEQYLAACSQAFNQHQCWYRLGNDPKPSELVTTVFSDNFFNGDSEIYFDDAQACILMRSFLEVVPADAEVVLDMTELVHGGYIDLDEHPNLYDHWMQLLLQRLDVDYQLYGFVIEEDPNVDRRLREKLDAMSEDLFIDRVLLPLIERMGFQRVRKVSYHGRNEFGSDILPFRYSNPLGTLEYYALQAKAVSIHGTSSKSGNAGELISQANQAFNVAFVDDLDNERKRIDKFIIATSKAITPDARHVIESAFEGNRQVVFLDIDRVVALVKQHRLVQYLLFSPE